MSTAKRKISASAGEPFFQFSSSEKQHFLATFIENMTVAVRDAYLLQPDKSAAMLKSWNELLHRVADSLMAYIENSDRHYPDEVLFDMIEAVAAAEGLRSQIDWAKTASYRYVQSKKKVSRKVAAAH
jgi:hypothetical protein